MDLITEKIIGSVAAKLTTDGIHKCFNNKTLGEKVERALQNALDKVAPDNEFWKNDVLRQCDDVITILIRILDDSKYLENNLLPNYLDKETIQWFENYLKEDTDTWNYLHQLLLEYISRETREISQETKEISQETKDVTFELKDRVTRIEDKLNKIVDDNFSNNISKPTKNERKEFKDRLSLICRLIQSNNRITTVELALKTSSSVNTIRRDINTLLQEGVITREGSTKQGYWVVVQDKCG